MIQEFWGDFRKPLKQRKFIKFQEDYNDISKNRSDTEKFSELLFARSCVQLVDDNGSHYILMSSDLDLCPINIIEIYSYRSKIEVTFDMLKNLLGGSCSF
jgi:hypothetical protein